MYDNGCGILVDIEEGTNEVVDTFAKPVVARNDLNEGSDH